MTDEASPPVISNKLYGPCSPHEPLMLQERLAALQHKVTPKERGTLLWAYGNLRCYPGQDLMDALCAEPARNIQAYDSQVGPELELRI